jgi:outer membrane protein OmpA-like peptidoglycan-associated protein
MLLLLAASMLATGCGSSTSTVVSPPLLEGEEIRQMAVTLTPLDALNSPADDFGATMPLDSTMILFSSAREGAIGPHSIFMSRMQGGRWGEPALAVEINNGHSNGLPSITPGGESVYFAGHEYGFGDADIYRADVGPRGDIPDGMIPWSIPSNLGLRVNGTGWDSEPCISADGSILYFSSDRPGGFGNRDIWVCKRRSDGTWDTPVNAGETINTPFDEVTPWVSPDGQSLFFSSNGRPGLGGFDIFAATTVAGVTVVNHLGTPINSSNDDIAMSLSADGKHAFMASNRSGGRGGFDLYQVTPVPVTVDPLMVVRGSVRGADGKPLQATIEVTDLSSEQMMGSFRTDPESGIYTLVLPRGYNYALTASAPGHLFNSQQMLVPRDLERDAERRMDFALQSIRGTIRLLVFFRPNESNLQRESTSDLDRVVTFLTANPDLKVEIAGHSDNSGDARAALELSRQRAQAVKSYLVGNRIQGERITVTGYGSTQPIADNDTEEGRAMNRRVEMRVK